MADVGYWAATVVAAILGTFGIRTEEEPRYEVRHEEGAAQVRSYAPQVVIETSMRGMDDESTGTAFQRLAGYIFGANVEASKVAMTAPVTMEARSMKIDMTAPVTTRKEGDAMVMRFVLPAKFSADTAPRPTDPEVRLRQAPSEIVGAWRFSGRATKARAAACEAELRSWLAARGFEATGPARLAGYDPPFTIPLLRRNEILVPVRSRP